VDGGFSAPALQAGSSSTVASASGRRRAAEREFTPGSLQEPL
jgi:hypothetical protein